MKAAVLFSIFMHAAFFLAAFQPGAPPPEGKSFPRLSFAGTPEDLPGIPTELPETDPSVRPGPGSLETEAPVIEPGEFPYRAEWSPPRPPVDLERLKKMLEEAPPVTGSPPWSFTEDLKIDRLPVEERVAP